MANAGVYLNVEYAQRSIEFYEGLGFKVMDRHENEDGHAQWVQLDLYGAQLHLGEIAASQDPGFRDWVDGTLGRGVIAWFTLEDVDPVWEAAQAIEADVDQPLNDHMGTPSFTLNDPDGYVVSFIQDA